MNNFTFYTPTRVVFGKDTQKQLGALVAQYGYKKVLIHYGGGSVKKSGLFDQVVASLKEKGIQYVELGGVKPNPELKLVNEGIALCRKEGVDLVLAVGGGSAIDSAKHIAVGAKNDEDVWLFTSKVKVPTAALPIGVVLTLAATGSEMSASAVITNENGWLKRGYNSDFNRPLFAIMNPELTYTLPPFQTGCGIVDIIMHTLERYFSKGSDTALSDRMAEGLMKAVMDAGRVAMADPTDYEARATLMWAGSLSHNDLTGAGREVFMPVHQIEHEISGIYTDVAHGAGLSAVLSTWMRYVYKNNVSRFAQFAVRVMDCEMDFEHPERTAELGIDRLEAFFKSLDMPVRLSGLGITSDEKFDEMAEKATFFGKRILTGVMELGKKEIIEILKLSM
jgi:hypothetical protein